jgi:hypothetical protein
MISLILAAAIASPCPVTPKAIKHRKHHKVAAVVCASPVPAPRYILLPAPAPEPAQPAIVYVPSSQPPPVYELNEYTYVDASMWFVEFYGASRSPTTITVENPTPPRTPWPVTYAPQPFTPCCAAPVHAPELDSTSTGAALTLLAGGLLILRGRQK